MRINQRSFWNKVYWVLSRCCRHLFFFCFLYSVSLLRLFFHLFCCLNSQNNHNGFKLKELIIENGIVAKALKYLEKQTPQKPFRYAWLLLPFINLFIARKGEVRKPTAVPHGNYFIFFLDSPHAYAAKAFLVCCSHNRAVHFGANIPITCRL